MLRLRIQFHDMLPICLEKRIRTVLYKLCERETTADLYRVDSESRARRICVRRDQMDTHRLFQQQGCLRSH